MKKLSVIFCALLSVIITGCNDNKLPDAPQSRRLELDTTTMYFDQHYRVYTLEGCEYIVVGYGKERWGGHKGNCKNPIHKTQENEK
jgi:hypothetical protein